ncbi:MAG TPA: hypothetical protein VNO31_10790 [Umezawaea sp.]|nr:hypothetical protein [Umezawaea sp.]
MPETRHFVPPPGTTPRGRGWLRHGSHPHVEGLLVYAAAGALAMTTERGTRVAPANRVTWTPPGFAHSHRFDGRTDTRLVVIPAELCGRPRRRLRRRPGRQQDDHPRRRPHQVHPRVRVRLAGMIPRGANAGRLYLQCPPDDTLEQWPDVRHVDHRTRAQRP